MSYKYKINTELLTQFYLTDSITQEMLNEVDKVILVVLVKHFSNYATNSDLKQFAILAVLERRAQYDPSFSAYNYTYTIVRNEIGNKIKKYGQETFLDDLSPLDTRSVVDEALEFPPELQRYLPYLIGTKSFNYLRIPKSDVINLLMFIRLNTTKTLSPVPDFLQDSSQSLSVALKLLNDIINGK